MCKAMAISLAPLVAACSGSACSSRMNSEPQRERGAGVRQQSRISAAGRSSDDRSTAGLVAATLGIAAGTAAALAVFLITLVIVVTVAIAASPVLLAALLWLYRSRRAGRHWSALKSSSKVSPVVAGHPRTLQLQPISSCRKTHSRGSLCRLPLIPEDTELLWN